jgi:hypothetical protein
MITFGDICGLAFLIGFATLIINWLIYERQQSKEKEMWNIIHNEIDNFVQFLASLKSANEISVREIDWYVNKYCRIERKEITDDFMLEALDRRDTLLGKHFIGLRSGTTEKFNLMDKYKNTENFNEVEFFQELNEKLRKFEPKERHRVELAINKGRYLKHANSGQYIDFNNVLKFEAITRANQYNARTMKNVIDTKIFFKHKEETSECYGVEIVELFNKWKMKQEKINLINHL